MSDTYTPLTPGSWPKTIELIAVTEPVLGGIGGDMNVGIEDNGDRGNWLYDQRLIDFTFMIETASGGRATVIIDDNDNWNVMARIPKFKPVDLDADLGSDGLYHPAFREGVTVHDYIYVGLFQAADIGGDLVSQPFKNPATDTFANHKASCVNNGAGWHMMTLHEYAALCLLSRKIVDVLHGNTDYTYSHLDSGEHGIPASSSDYIKSGSGPNDWRHDLHPYGVADLVGNYPEFCNLVKTVNSQLMFPITNDFTLVEGSWPTQGVYYSKTAPGGSLMYSDASSIDRLQYTAYFSNMSNSFGAVPAIFNTSLMCDLILHFEWYKAAVWTAPLLVANPSIPGIRTCMLESATHYMQFGGESNLGANCGLGNNTDADSASTAACRLVYIP